MSDYNHYKHGHLPDNVKGIKRNQSSETHYESVGGGGGSGGGKGPSIAKRIDRKVLATMHSMMSLPDEHIQTYNSLWFGLIEFIDDCTRKERIDEKSLELLEKLTNSEVFLNESEITSRQDIANRLGEIDKIVRKYVD